jgi:3-dehydroquinate synthase
MTGFFLSESDTKIIVHRYSLDQLAAYLVPLSKPYSQVVLISTSPVFHLYGRKVIGQLKKIGLRTTEILISEGEQAKTLQQASFCWEQMARLQLDRHALVLALGGGATTDLAGFVASCYMRGIDTIYLPTTLMAMVDAAIGGKTGINFIDNKNFLGTFYLPKLIVIDPNCLTTLPSRELSAGLAEIIKYAIINDEALFEELESHVEALRQGNIFLLEKFICRSCQIKCEITRSDFKDTKDIRACLNYGHTFAHAIEGLTNYQDYLHGEAVSIGMSCAAYLSYCMGKINRSIVDRQDTLCRRAGLPIQFPSNILIDQLIERMKGDKKSIKGKISLILPQKIGKVFKFSDIDQELIKQTLLTKDRNSLERTRSASIPN